MLQRLLILNLFLISLIACSDTYESSSNQMMSAGDCRNVGSACNVGFTCSPNMTGAYECLPSQSSTTNVESNSGDTNGSFNESYDESYSDSSSTGSSSSESDITCCSGGQGYMCPDRTQKDLCFRGESHSCTLDSTVSCGGSSGQTTSGSNSCLEAGDLCQQIGDCCDDALCVDGVCSSFCNDNYECSSECCAAAEYQSQVYGVCAPATVCEPDTPAVTPEATCVDMVLCAGERCDAVGMSSSMCYSSECVSGSGASKDIAINLLGCVLYAKNHNADCDLSDLPDRTPDCLVNECLDDWGECLSN